MTKYCPNCGKDNDDNSTFCRYCGKKLSGIHDINIENKPISDNKEKKLWAIVIVLIIAIAIIGTFAFMAINDNNENTEPTNNKSNEKISDSSVSDVSSVNTKTWHKVDSFSGVGGKTITLTAAGNPIKVTSSAMPIKNYADNYMQTSISKNGFSVGSSQLSWNSKSAVATKSDSIEFTGTGTYDIYISTYELQYWNLEIYEYY
ncbi:zinc ribbon domain-containing protein [Methanobrevibacter sp. OttesenSCG-928-K11]|nr:zinc ribbon domain-containing protein [Methanobrevibacter sp. OttesenSCG-928-K11]MDL2270827.1 zinc ribbon domain-containing protein [Methanobrevibacter sp. OttesenSCG-928-I08]